jgi:2-iminobutanoate/2-iminopropanoate deaminase
MECGNGKPGPTVTAGHRATASSHVISTAEAPAPVGPYVQGISVDGARLVFVSGQLPIDRRSGEMIEPDVVAQTRLSLDNALAIVEASGGDRSHVVKVTMFVSNLEHGPLINRAYQACFGESLPARTTVEVRRLPGDALLEVDLIAAIPTGYPDMSDATTTETGDRNP